MIFFFHLDYLISLGLSTIQSYIDALVLSYIDYLAVVCTLLFKLRFSMLQMLSLLVNLHPVRLFNKFLMVLT